MKRAVSEDTARARLRSCPSRAGPQPNGVFELGDGINGVTSLAEALWVRLRGSPLARRASVTCKPRRQAEERKRRAPNNPPATPPPLPFLASISAPLSCSRRRFGARWDPCGDGARRPRAHGTDCAVGSGQWAEPPHPPWALHRRGSPEGTFWPPAGGPPPEAPEDQSPQGGSGGAPPTVQRLCAQTELTAGKLGLPAPRCRKSQRSESTRGNAECAVRGSLAASTRGAAPQRDRSRHDRHVDREATRTNMQMVVVHSPIIACTALAMPMNDLCALTIAWR